MNNNNSLEQAVQNFLEDKAKNDSLFADTFKKANKSIKECCKYIMQCAQKMAKNQRALAVSDATVFGWAIHYYDEDDIKVDNNIQKQVKVETPIPQSQQKEKSRPILKNQPKRRKQEDNSLQLSLFGE